MQSDTILLSDFIILIKTSINKIPRVKNYDTLVSLHAKCKTMLKEKGDFEIPKQGLLNQLN